jgi:hypothetical protein
MLSGGDRKGHCVEVQRTDDAKRVVEKEPFEEPRLTYVKPELVELGDISQHTFQGGFFGVFSP